MATLPVPEDANIHKLAEELVAAFPEWVPTINGEKIALFRINEHEVTFPDETPTAEVQAVLDAHDGSTLSDVQADKLARAAMLRRLKDDYQRLMQDVAQGRVQLDQGNDATWNARTAAAKIDRLRTVALGQMDFDESVLEALRVLVLRTGT